MFDQRKLKDIRDKIDELLDGEYNKDVFIGVLNSITGNHQYELYLCPEEEILNWYDSFDFAKSLDADLPSIRELVTIEDQFSKYDSRLFSPSSFIINDVGGTYWSTFEDGEIVYCWTFPEVPKPRISIKIYDSRSADILGKTGIPKFGMNVKVNKTSEAMVRPVKRVYK